VLHRPTREQLSSSWLRLTQLSGSILGSWTLRDFAPGGLAIEAPPMAAPNVFAVGRRRGGRIGPRISPGRRL